MCSENLNLVYKSPLYRHLHCNEAWRVGTTGSFTTMWHVRVSYVYVECMQICTYRYNSLHDLTFKGLCEQECRRTRAQTHLLLFSVSTMYLMAGLHMVCLSDQAVDFWTSNLMFSWSRMMHKHSPDTPTKSGKFPILFNFISVTTHLKLRSSLLCHWTHEPNPKRKLCTVWLLCNFINSFWMPLRWFPFFNEYLSYQSFLFVNCALSLCSLF